MLAEENGVDILEWEYWKEISEESVKTFLVEHDVQIEKSEESLVVSSNEMLPVIQDAKKKKVIIKTQREVTEWYVQYSMEGKFVEKYVSA